MNDALFMSAPSNSRNGPKWSTVNQAMEPPHAPVKKSPFLRDRLQPLPDVPSSAKTNSSFSHHLASDNSMDSSNTDEPLQRKLQVLERNVAFMRSQHHEMLTALQTEIESLKKKNKEIQFQLIVQDKDFETPEETNVDKRAAGARVTDVGDKYKRDVLLQEITSLQQELQEERQRNKRMTILLEEQTLEMEKQKRSGNKAHPQDIVAHLDNPDQHQAPTAIDRLVAVDDGTYIGLEPFRIILPDATTGQLPTSMQCQRVFRVMLERTDRLEEQLCQLRNKLDTEVPTPATHHSSKSIPPDQPEAGNQESGHAGKLPALLPPPQRLRHLVDPPPPPLSGDSSRPESGQASRPQADHTLPHDTATSMKPPPGQRLLPLRAPRQAPRTLSGASADGDETKPSLPALHQALDINLAERRRRTQLLQKKRLESSKSVFRP